MPIQFTKTHAFFYTEWPSNFWRAPFKYKDHDFFCTEQAFMWEKAVFFNDKETERKILAASTPKEAKNLGRQVKNFVTEEWDKVRYQVMVDVNYAKYSQVEDCKKRLLDPKFDGHTFVEASPIDGIWGIRMAQNEPGIEDPSNWKGRNLLGKALTEVRDRLKQEASAK